MKKTISAFLAAIMFVFCFSSFAIGSYSEVPNGENAYANTLFYVDGTVGAWTLKNLKTGKYLTCDGNATYGDAATPFTVTAATGGVKIALAEATGGKSAGSALHFGSSNRLSFGDASVFAVYKYEKDETFSVAENVEAGEYYLFAYVTSAALYALSGSVYGSGSSSRIETEAVTVTLAGEEGESPYKDVLFTASKSNGAYTFQNTDNELYLADQGNACLGQTPVTFTVEAVTDGVNILRTEYSGDHAALHLGSNNRVSYGSPSLFSIYAYVVHNEKELFEPVDHVEDGGTYLIIYKSGAAFYALTGSTYNPGVSSRIETRAVTIEIFDRDKAAFENSDYLSLIYKASVTDGVFTFKHVETFKYLGCGGNAALTDSPAPFTLSEISGGYSIALAESVGGKAAGDALHCGSGNRLSYGTASAFNFYEYVENDLFAKVSQPLDGKYYLIVYTKSGVNYAMTGVTYSSGSSSRIETAETAIGLYECGNHSYGEGEVTELCTFTSDGKAVYTCRYCGETLEESLPAATFESVGSAIVRSESGVNSVSFIGAITGSNIDFESVDKFSVTLEFTADGQTVKTKKANVYGVYTTLTGLASTDEITAQSQQILFEDADYLFGVTVRGVPSGTYGVVFKIEAILNNETVSQTVTTVEVSI